MKANRSRLLDGLEDLGVRAGDLLMVHAGVRSIGPVVGGVNVLIQALFDAIGPHGTLAAYVDFEPFYDEDDAPEDIPVFDKRIANAARDHGVIGETLRNWPGAVRSDHPDAGIVAIGPLAHSLTRDHSFQYGYGDGSPFERFVQANGRVLMIGAPLDTITLLHHAEHKANIPNKRVIHYRRRMPSENGSRWIAFEEFDTTQPVTGDLPDDCFERIATAFLESGKGRKGQIGSAASHLFDAPELVPFAVRWLERVGRQTL